MENSISSSDWRTRYVAISVTFLKMLWGKYSQLFVYADCSFKSPLFGITQSAVTEILTRSKTREATNGTIIGSTNVVNQLQTEIWEPVDPNVTLEEEDLDCLKPNEGDGQPDIYEDDEARVFHERDVRYETSRDEDVIVQEHDPYDKIYQNLPLAHHVLRKVPNCEYCGAVKFPGEGDAFCCGKGKVNIFIPDVPENNPYVHTFRSLGQVANLDEYKIELNTSISVDQRRFNAPAMEQVAAIWQDGTNEQRRFTRSIMVYAKSGHAHFIRAYYGCYDPLSYPVFYP